jgi:uncharacterized membrane-anchored protein
MWVVVVLMVVVVFVVVVLVVVQLHSVLSSALDGLSVQIQASAALATRKLLQTPIQYEHESTASRSGSFGLRTKDSCLGYKSNQFLCFA